MKAVCSCCGKELTVQAERLCVCGGRVLIAMAEGDDFSHILHHAPACDLFRRLDSLEYLEVLKNGKESN